VKLVVFYFVLLLLLLSLFYYFILFSLFFFFVGGVLQPDPGNVARRSPHADEALSPGPGDSEGQDVRSGGL
jgi:hypothetical protein